MDTPTKSFIKYKKNVKFLILNTKHELHQTVHILVTFRSHLCKTSLDHVLFIDQTSILPHQIVIDKHNITYHTRISINKSYMQRMRQKISACRKCHHFFLLITKLIKLNHIQMLSKTQRKGIKLTDRSVETS